MQVVDHFTARWFCCVSLYQATETTCMGVCLKQAGTIPERRVPGLGCQGSMGRSLGRSDQELLLMLLSRPSNPLAPVKG